MTPRLNFDVDVNLPVAGKSPRARHASSTGAQVASRRRGVQTVRYLALLEERGPLSDYEAYDAMKPHVHNVSSICSIRNGCGPMVVASELYENTPFRTKRTRWRRASLSEMET